MKIEVARSGDIGYAIDAFEGTGVDSAGDLIPVRGKAIVIWKKQPDGSWKVAADMFSPDSPADMFGTDSPTEPGSRASLLLLSPDGATPLSVGLRPNKPITADARSRHLPLRQVIDGCNCLSSRLAATGTRGGDMFGLSS